MGNQHSANGHTDPIQQLVTEELQRIDNNVFNLLGNISWQMNDYDLSDIRYSFENYQRAQDILKQIPYTEPSFYGYEGDPTLALTHPVVNTLMNIPLVTEPVVLYLKPAYNKPYQRVVFDDIKTAFDILGAINTYYQDLTRHANENDRPYYIQQILTPDHIYFVGLEPYQDGYRLAD